MDQIPPPPPKGSRCNLAKALAWVTLVALSLFIATWFTCFLSKNPPVNAAQLLLHILLGTGLLLGLELGGFVCLRWLCRWRNLRRVLFGLACLATLLALFFTEENWRGNYVWRKHRHALEAKGEKLDLPSLAPPPVPDDKNFASTPLLSQGLAYTNGGTFWSDPNGHARLERVNAERRRTPNSDEHLPLGRLDTGTFADLTACAAFYRGNTNYPQAPPTASPAETLLVALGQFDPELNELRQAAAHRPECRFPIHYEQESPSAILLLHLAYLKPLNMVTQVRALAELEAGQPAPAFEDLKLGLRLADGIQHEPFLICHLVRMALLVGDLQTVREGLHRHAWTEGQLAELEACLSKLDLLAEYKFAIRSERACVIQELEHLPRLGPTIHPWDHVGGPQSGDALTLVFMLMPRGWLCQNMLTLSRLHEEFALAAVDERAHRVFPQVSDNGARRVEQMRAGPYTMFAQRLFAAYVNAVQKPAHMQAYVDAARVACALERCRLAEGKLPETLPALVPRFLPAVPNDVMDGQPLRYHPSPSSGYLLYSVGWNQRDNGGRMAWLKDKPEPTVDIDNGDWVWKME